MCVLISLWPHGHPRSWEASWFQWREDVLFRNSLEVAGCEKCWQYIMRRVCALIRSQWRRQTTSESGGCWGWVILGAGYGGMEDEALWGLGAAERWWRSQPWEQWVQWEKARDFPGGCHPTEQVHSISLCYLYIDLIFWAPFDFSAIIDLGSTLRMGRFIQEICQAPVWQWMVSTFWVCKCMVALS